MEDQGVDDRIISKWFNNVWGSGLDSTGSGWDPVVGFAEHGKETSGSTHVCISLTGCVSASFW